MRLGQVTLTPLDLWIMLGLVTLALGVVYWLLLPVAIVISNVINQSTHNRTETK